MPKPLIAESALSQLKRRGAETGLESPGRRQILKQGAAAAARAAVPDAIGNLVGTTALKQAVKDAVTSPAIPDESIQAAIAAAMSRVMKNKKFMQAWNDNPDALQDIIWSMDNYGDLPPSTPFKPGSIDAIVGSLSPSALATKYNLPKEAVNEYFKKAGNHPRRCVGNWVNSRLNLESFWDSTDKHRFRDWGFDEFPTGTTEEALNEAKRAAKETEDFEPLYNLYLDGHRKQNVGSYESLLGEKEFRDLRLKHGDVYGDPVDHYEQMQDSIYDNDRLHEFITEFGLGE